MNYARKPHARPRAYDLRAGDILSDDQVREVDNYKLEWDCDLRFVRSGGGQTWIVEEIR